MKRIFQEQFQWFYQCVTLNILPIQFSFLLSQKCDDALLTRFVLTLEFLLPINLFLIMPSI